jgi:predicted transcriptional regulator
LFTLRLLEQSYARELARVIGTSLSAVQKALRTLERDGIVVGRVVGRTRVFQISPRYFAVTELERFLTKLLESEVELKRRAGRLRKRPRRTGKPL